MPIHDWTRVRAGIFHDFHHEWISTLKRALNGGRLPSDYYALVALPKDDLRGRGGIDVATAPPRVRFIATTETERYANKRSRIAIRHISDDHVVAILEIVSSGNKSSRHALRSFVEKVVELLDAGIHLLIVDLFPPGRRDPEGMHAAIWGEISEDNFRLPADKRLTLVAYSAGELTRAFIESAAVGDVLPDMPLFLEPNVYVPVPLEASYQNAFEAVPRRWQDELRTS